MLNQKVGVVLVKGIRWIAAEVRYQVKLRAIFPKWVHSSTHVSSRCQPAAITNAPRDRPSPGYSYGRPPFLSASLGLCFICHQVRFVCNTLDNLSEPNQHFRHWIARFLLVGSPQPPTLLQLLSRVLPVALMALDNSYLRDDWPRSPDNMLMMARSCSPSWGRLVGFAG